MFLKKGKCTVCEKQAGAGGRVGACVAPDGRIYAEHSYPQPILDSTNKKDYTRGKASRLQRE